MKIYGLRYIYYRFSGSVYWNIVYVCFYFISYSNIHGIIFIICINICRIINPVFIFMY